MAAEFEFATRAFIPSATALVAPLTTAADWPMAVEPEPPAVELAPIATAPVFVADEARPNASASSTVADAPYPIAVVYRPAVCAALPIAICLSLVSLFFADAPIAIECTPLAVVAEPTATELLPAPTTV